MEACDGSQTHSVAFAGVYGLIEAHLTHGVRDVVISWDMELAMVEAVP